MSLLLLLKYRDKKLWKAALQVVLPNEQIEVYPNVTDPSSVDFIVTMSPTQAEVEQFPNVKVIQSLGAGIDYILKANVLRPDNILARMVNPNLTHDMFEFVLSILLSQMKNLPTYQQQQTQRLWKPMPYRSIKDITVTIWGLGKIGSYVAEKLTQLGFKVKGWSKSPKNIHGVKSYTGQDGLIQSITSTDFLVNILPLTPNTFEILNYQNLQHLPKGAYVINVGRGQHNQEKDLIELLNQGHLSGFASDVFHQEPLPTAHPFWNHPKISITPHIAGITAPHASAEAIADNYLRFKAGEPLKNVVDLNKGY